MLLYIKRFCRMRSFNFMRLNKAIMQNEIHLYSFAYSIYTELDLLCFSIKLLCRMRFAYAFERLYEVALVYAFT